MNKALYTIWGKYGTYLSVGLILLTIYFFYHITDVKIYLVDILITVLNGLLMLVT